VTARLLTQQTRNWLQWHVLFTLWPRTSMRLVMAHTYMEHTCLVCLGHNSIWMPIVGLASMLQVFLTLRALPQRLHQTCGRDKVHRRHPSHDMYLYHVDQELTSHGQLLS
jgi:hypothetical protein